MRLSPVGTMMLVMLLVASSNPAAAQEAHVGGAAEGPGDIPGVPDWHGQIWDTPFYDPVSKRYFEMKWAHAGYGAKVYSQFDKEAQSLSFKGVQGRLAVVDSVEVHEFLLKTFHPIWNTPFGLRYICKTRQLESSDGKILTPQSFQAWATDWDEDQIANFCLKDAYWPYATIAYSPATGTAAQAKANGTSAEHFRWIAKGPQKGFWGYFVEFPTGHE